MDQMIKEKEDKRRWGGRKKEGEKRGEKEGKKEGREGQVRRGGRRMGEGGKKEREVV